MQTIKISPIVYNDYIMKFSRLIIHLLIPAISLFLAQIISFSQPNNFQFKPEMNVMIPINYLLWLCVYSLCFSLFKKTRKSIYLYLLTFSIFTLVNHFKIKILYQSFTFTDFKLLKNLILFWPNFIKQSQIIQILILTIIILFFSFIILKKKCQNTNSKISRLILFPTSILVLLIPLIFTEQYNNILYKSELIIYRTNPIENCKKNGILFCFLDDLKNIKKETPPDYNKSTIQKIYSEINISKEKTDNNIKPNIIVILSESLFDATKLTNVKFNQDPIKNIRADMKSNLITPQLSSGTGNVEFEIITGLSNYFLNGKFPYSQVIRQDAPSLFTIFKEQGYLTTVIHPYLRSMYNRTTVYKHFGLDKFISIEDIEDYQKSGPYVSDKSFMDQIIRQYESTNQPQFIFGLTMQNHYPFEPSRFSEHPVTFTDNLPGIEHQILQSYVDGINLSDISYQFLKEKILSSSKPTIVIYFGDHLPLLLSKFDLYQLLDYVVREEENWNNEDKSKMYTTPIAIYSNFPTNLDIKPRISPNFLSLEILKFANVTPKYQFKFLQSLSSTDTVLNQYFTDNFTPKQINDYSLIQYDIISGHQYFTQF